MLQKIAEISAWHSEQPMKQCTQTKNCIMSALAKNTAVAKRR